MKRLKVFIVSENRLLRDMLARIFEQEQGLAVVGVARLCREAIEEDAVLLEISDLTPARGAYASPALDIANLTPEQAAARSLGGRWHVFARLMSPA